MEGEREEEEPPTPKATPTRPQSKGYGSTGGGYGSTGGGYGSLGSSGSSTARGGRGGGREKTKTVGASDWSNESWADGWDTGSWGQPQTTSTTKSSAKEAASSNGGETLEDGWGWGEDSEWKDIDLRTPQSSKFD